MEAMLQRHCARYIYVIPDGLRELMSDISREVLRSQPEDMYTFIADYLDALMITRENARVAARLVESLTEMATTTAEFLEETGIPRTEIDLIVTAIHRTFRKTLDSEDGREQISDEVEEANIVHDIMSETNIDSEQAEMAAKIIQQAYRKFKERNERERELLAGIIDWRVAARSAIQLYRRTGVTNEEANRAATLIKAAYKGYYTRRMMRVITTLEKDSIILDQAFQFISKRESEEEYEDEGGEEEQEEQGEEEEEGSLDKHKAVTINYDTVIPHVDFDMPEPDLNKTEGQKEPSARLSTSSSIAKHSVRFIIDTALGKIPKESIIPEETVIEDNAVSTAEQVQELPALPNDESESNQQNVAEEVIGVDNIEQGEVETAPEPSGSVS